MLFQVDEPAQRRGEGRKAVGSQRGAQSRLQQLVGGPRLRVRDVRGDSPKGFAQRLGGAALLPTPLALPAEAAAGGECPGMEAREGREDEGACLAWSPLPWLLLEQEPRKAHCHGQQKA
jgi:hypothetical protein